MDSSPQMGSFWKGRLLLSLECNPHNSPIFSDPNQPEPIPKEILKKASTGKTKINIIYI